MPVRNAAPWLNESVGSILRQTGPSFELIIVDDGSDDGSATLLDAFAQSHDAVHVIHQPSQGIVSALNTGLQKASGRYIARMDADDVALPGRLDLQVRWMQNHPDVVAAGAAQEDLLPSGSIIPPASLPDWDASQVRSRLLTGNCINHPTVIFDRQTVLDLGGYRPPFRHAEDYDLWLRLSERHAVQVMPFLVLRYRVHSGQTGHQFLESQTLAVLAAQLSASARQRRLPDPALHWSHPPSPPELALEGLTPERLDNAVATATFDLIERYQYLGMTSEAAQVHQQLLSWIRTHPRRSSNLADWHWWKGRFHFVQAHFLRGSADFCLAFVRKPSLLIRTLRGLWNFPARRLHPRR